MVRPTKSQEVLRESIENTRASLIQVDAGVDQLMRMVVRYTGDGLMSNGVALAFTNEVQQLS